MVLREHGDALEADFERVYRIDICDLWRGHLSPRKAAVLLMGLPPGSLVWQELGEDAAWTAGEHLLAATVDALNIANWQRSDGKGKQPDPLPRPRDIKADMDKRQKMLDRASKFKQRKKATKPDQN